MKITHKINMLFLSIWMSLSSFFSAKALKAQEVAGGIIATVIGFIVVMYVVAYTFTPLADSATTLANVMNTSTISGVAGLSSLPGVAVLLFILLVILGLIMSVVKE